MNINDSEIINSILQQKGYQYSAKSEDCEIIFLNTCAIREKAESKIWQRLQEIRAQKRKKNNEINQKQIITGVLGCMAERLKEKLFQQNKVVDIIAGPDAYRDLPNLIKKVYQKQNQQSQENQQKQDDFTYSLTSQAKTQYNSHQQCAINVKLSFEETYSDIVPKKLNQNQKEKGKEKQAFVSIMRGCNNMCSFCIVPFTRGRERSREIKSILREIEILQQTQNIKEVVLLGQNVNSYLDESEQNFFEKHENTKGFGETFKLRNKRGARFSCLLKSVAEKFPEIRIRFTSPHPKDFPASVLEVISQYPNICKNIHMPAQSGNNEILQKMRRNYTKEAYLELIERTRQKLPGVSFSSDFIAGFCGESEKQFQDTLDLLEKVQFEQAFLFAYSMREKTHAHRQMKDDVLQTIKLSRTTQMNQIFLKNQSLKILQEKNNIHLLLIDNKGKLGNQFKGRTDTNRIAVISEGFRIPSISEKYFNFLKNQVYRKSNSLIIEDIEQMRETEDQNKLNFSEIQIGDFVIAFVEDTTNRTLFCKPLFKTSIQQFALISNNLPFIGESLKKQYFS